MKRKRNRMSSLTMPIEVLTPAERVVGALVTLYGGKLYQVIELDAERQVACLRFTNRYAEGGNTKCSRN